MSADAFQTKYASVMEGMLQSAVAETTKLFETMVDELKAEISRMKKENEDLRERCCQFESALNPSTVYISEPLPGRSGMSEKRDTAVQCDLVAFRTVLVEQSQPLSLSLQNQKHHSYRNMVYALQEHDYEACGEGNSQMAVTLVKEESVFKQEKESSLVFGQVLSDKADPPWASPPEAENEGPFIYKVCSTREIDLAQRYEEAQQALELPILGTHSNLQGTQDQSPELGSSLVGSVAAMKDDIPEGSQVGGAHGEFRSSKKHQFVACAWQQLEVEPTEREQSSVVPQQCQSEGQAFTNEQSDIPLQQYADAHKQLVQLTSRNKGDVCDELQNGVAKVKASSQPVLVQRRKGRPPKRGKHPVKKGPQSKSLVIPATGEVKQSVTVRVKQFDGSTKSDTVDTAIFDSPQACPGQPKESSSIRSPSKQKRASTAINVVKNTLALQLAAQQLSKNVKGGAILAPSTAVSLNNLPAESAQTISVQQRESRTAASVQDAMLLVEAMYQPMAENVLSSQRQTAAFQTQCASGVAALQTVDAAPAELQTFPYSVEPHEAVHNLPTTELSIRRRLKTGKHSAPPQTADFILSNEAQGHSRSIIPKLKVTAVNNSTLQVPPSSQISVQTFQQPQPHPLIISIAPSTQGKTVSHKVIVVPRSMILKPHKPPTQLPTVSPMVAAAQNSIPKGSTAADLPLETISSSSVPEKTIFVTSSKSPSLAIESTATSADLQSGTRILPELISVVPGQKSLTIDQTAQQESTKSDAVGVVSQESSISVDTQTAVDEGPKITPQKKNNTPENLESPKQTAPVLETANAHSQTSSNFIMSDGLVIPPDFKQKLSAVVALTRLPFPLSTKESVLISRLPTAAGFDCRSVLKPGTAQEESSTLVTSKQPSETAEIYANSEEPSVDVSINTPQMSEDENDIEQKELAFSENGITLKELPNSQYVQLGTPSYVSQSAFENSTIAINSAEPSAASGTAVHPISNLKEEINSITVPDRASGDDQPVEENQSATLINPDSNISKDTSDPQLLTAKSQFLPQLAVSPAVQVPTQASDNTVDCSSSCAEAKTSGRKKSRKHIMAQLRSHIKNHSQARKTEARQQTETHTVSYENPCLENDSNQTPNNENQTSEPGAVEDVASLKTTDDPSPIIPALCQEADEINKASNGTSYNSSRKSESTSELIPVGPCSFGTRTDDLGSKNEKSISLSTRWSGSTKESGTTKKTKNVIVYPGVTNSTGDDARLRNGKGGSPNSTKPSRVGLKRNSSSPNAISPKRSKSTSVISGTPGSTKNCTSPKIANNESTLVTRRSCPITKDGSATKQIERECKSTPRRRNKITDSATHKNTKSESDSPTVRRLKLTKCNSPRKTGESTCAKKLRLDGTSPKKNLRVVNARKLADTAKARTITKKKTLNRSQLKNKGTTSQPAAHCASGKPFKKCKSQAVWTPPKMLASEAPSAKEKRAANLSVKNELTSEDRPVVYPPSVSLRPIPVKAAPVVSPLEPLSVIGRRLLKNQCGECGRVLSSRAALESHVRLHTGKRPFSCTLCGKRFADTTGLKRHDRVHRNGRIHVCQQCGKGFVYRFSLTKHLQTVHSRIKPFVCQICNKGCFTKLDVEAHIRIHTGEKPFHCNLCEKKFTRRVELNVHLRWHNGEKRHWCPYCGKGFLDFNNLKRHKYIHTGEKPHSCPHCPKHFTQSGHLKKHVKNVHKIK